MKKYFFLLFVFQAIGAELLFKQNKNEYQSDLFLIKKWIVRKNELTKDERSRVPGALIRLSSKGVAGATFVGLPLYGAWRFHRSFKADASLGAGGGQIQQKPVQNKDILKYTGIDSLSQDKVTQFFQELQLKIKSFDKITIAKLSQADLAYMADIKRLYFFSDDQLGWMDTKQINIIYDGLQKPQQKMLIGALINDTQFKYYNDMKKVHDLNVLSPEQEAQLDIKRFKAYFDNRFFYQLLSDGQIIQLLDSEKLNYIMEDIDERYFNMLMKHQLSNDQLAGLSQAYKDRINQYNTSENMKKIIDTFTKFGNPLVKPQDPFVKQPDLEDQIEE